MPTYTNSQMNILIDEHIHSERDRRLLKRRLASNWLRSTRSGSICSRQQFPKWKHPLTPSRPRLIRSKKRLTM